MNNDFLKQNYKYYYMICERPNTYSPWSFAGIMGDIQHSLYNGEGLEPYQIESANLENRIRKLKSDEQHIALAELDKAKKLAERRIRERKNTYTEKEQNQKTDAIRAYRQSWKKTSFFYKISHKSQNPKNMNFGDLSSSEINRETSYLR